MTIEAIADYACRCGEGPLYHPDENAVYWTDNETGSLFRYDITASEHRQVYKGENVGGITLQEDGSLLLFLAKGAIRSWRNGEFLETIHEDIPDERETRFNDVIADPAGRVFCGTMPTPHRKGRLYRLDTDGTLTVLLEGIGCANGMGFTPDRKKFYFTDTGTREIYLFDYDEATGDITNQSVFIKTPDGEGGPDGLTIDAEGLIWSARWGGSGIFCYDPANGKQLAKVPLPPPNVTSLTFGGPDYDQMYVTTAGGHAKATDGPDAGALFRVTGQGLKGVPEFVSRIKAV